MMIRLRSLVTIALLVAGCAKQDNPFWCPGANPDQNCAEIDAGPTRCTDNTQCGSPTGICDTTTMTCVQCTASPLQASACAAATPVCGADDSCHGCTSH